MRVTIIFLNKHFSTYFFLVHSLQDLKIILSLNFKDFTNMQFRNQQTFKFIMVRY